MAGKARLPRRHAFPDDRRGPYPQPNLVDRPTFPRGGPPMSPISRPPLHPSFYEEEIELRHGEIQRLAADNRRLLEERIALHGELGVAKEEIHRLNVGFGEMRMEYDARTREMADKCAKMEVEVRTVELLRKEAQQLRAEVQRLNALRQEQVKNLTQDLSRAKLELKKVAVMKVDADDIRQELMHARAAFEYEKKGNAELTEQKLDMQKNMVSMAREVERLRVELANREGRTWNAGVPYGIKLNNPEERYPPSMPSYPDGLGTLSGSGDKPFYGVGPGSWGAYDKSRNVPR